MTDIKRRAPRPAVQSYSSARAHRVVSGPGAIDTLGAHLARLGAQRAFVITGRSVATKSSLIGQLKAAGNGCIVGVYDEMSAHTPLPDLVAALDMARAADADAIVAIGGGAVMDAGKYAVTCLSLGLRTPGEIRAFLAAQQPDPPAIANMLPQIAIPTTASAAEFTRVAGILDPDAKEKRRLDHPQIVPDVIIQDPQAVLFTPPDLWLSSAVRTLDHAVEGLYGPQATPFTDGLGKEAIRLLFRALPAFRADPTDQSAIADIQAATWLGASCGNPAKTGLSHGIGYLLGANFGVPHGHCSCITLQHVTEWVRPAAVPQLAEVARAMGVATAQTPDVDAAANVGPAIADLVARIGQPTRARDVSVPSKDALLGLAANVMGLPHIPGSPRQPRDLAEAEALLAAMW